MYILFINSGGRCDIFFSAQFNNNSNKKNCPSHRFNPTHVGWVGLDLCDWLDWVEIFFNLLWWVGSKNLLNPTHAHPYLKWFNNKCFKDVY